MAKRDKAGRSLDISIEHNGVEVDYQLAEGEGGVLQWFPTFIEEIPSEQRQESPFSYDGAPKVVSQVLDFASWADGAGFVDAPPGTTSFDGYSYSQGVDASWGKLIVSPKQIEMDTGDDFTGMYLSPSFGIYAWINTELYRLQSGDWVNLYTGGAAITDLIEYGNSTDVYLFLAMGDAQDIVYSVDGFATAPTSVDEEFSFFAIRGVASTQPILFGITSTGGVRTATNPTNTANFSNEDQIGSAGELVTAVVVADDKLWIFKEEGYYTFDGTDVAAQVPVDQLKRTGNGSQAHVWLNGFIYVNYANRLLRINPFDNTTEVFLAPSHPEINGSITAIASDTRWLYVFMLNSDGNTYCLKVNPVEGVAHTILYLEDREVNAALVVPASANSVSATNPTIIFGRSTQQD